MRGEVYSRRNSVVTFVAHEPYLLSKNSIDWTVPAGLAIPDWFWKQVQHTMDYQRDMSRRANMTKEEKYNELTRAANNSCSLPPHR